MFWIFEDIVARIVPATAAPIVAVKTVGLILPQEKLLPAPVGIPYISIHLTGSRLVAYRVSDDRYTKCHTHEHNCHQGSNCLHIEFISCFYSRLRLEIRRLRVKGLTLSYRL